MEKSQKDKGILERVGEIIDDHPVIATFVGLDWAGDEDSLLKSIAGLGILGRVMTRNRRRKDEEEANTP